MTRFTSMLVKILTSTLMAKEPTKLCTRQNYNVCSYKLATIINELLDLMFKYVLLKKVII